MRHACFRGVWPALVAAGLGLGLGLGLNPILPAAAHGAEPALPRVPEGFAIRLVAGVPTIEYTCQLATAPDGALYVAEDPMDQVGPSNQPIDRILVFREGKEPVVFAEKLNAVFGMAWYEGALYVMNMPRLTVLRDTDGDDRADERTDLFTDIGPRPTNLNDHIPSGLQFGIDGSLYISIGDKGVHGATGRDGRRVQLQGGGILRCRPDGTGIEVFSSGTRNHLEPNLDARDNLFTYDNTDDGDGWWTRVTHHIEAGYYGYPYDYHDRPDRFLDRMAEYGGGSPCGGVVYREDVWPEVYRGRAFWAEWGKRTVRAFRFEPRGASFSVGDVIDFVQPGDVGDFRPLDLAVSYDGRTLYIADWGLGGWMNKTGKYGRLYAVTYTGAVQTRPRGKDSDPIADQIRQLAHPSYNERMRAQRALIRNPAAFDEVRRALTVETTDPVARRHLVWALDGLAAGLPGGSSALIAALDTPQPADVRAQLLRALGQRRVAESRAVVSRLLADTEPSVRLQAIIALGRIAKPESVADLLPFVADDDPYLAFAARQALRRIGDWKAISRGLDSPDARVRLGVLSTLEMIYDREAAEALAQFARARPRPLDERARALALLAQGHRKVPPWDGRWWGTRPTRGRPPGKTLEWEGTGLVLETIRDLIFDPQPAVRTAAVAAVLETGDREMLAALRNRFAEEPDPAVRRVLALAFGTLGDRLAVPALIAALRAAETPEPVRAAALESVETIGGEAAGRALIDLLEQGALGVAQQPRVIAALGNFQARPAVATLLRSLASPAPAVRAAAAAALGKVGERDGVGPSLQARLDDPAPEVREAAITALGALGDRSAIPALVRAVEPEDTRYEAILALAAMPDLQALPVYLRGLTDRSQDLRRASAAALEQIRGPAVPRLDALNRRHELPSAAVVELQKIFTASQPVATWRVLGPFSIKDGLPFEPNRDIDFAATPPGVQGTPVAWTTLAADDSSGMVNLGRRYGTNDDVAAFAAAPVESAEDRPAHLVVGSDDTLTVWLNGKKVYDFDRRRSFKAEADRVEVRLRKGSNRLVVKCGNRGGGWQYSVAVTAPGDYAFLKGAPAGGRFDADEYQAFALKTRGNPEHGRALFVDLKGVACIKCHTVGKEGGTVGPELSTVGAKYPRDDLITSVLHPSARIFQGYESVVVATGDGRILTGIVKNETPAELEIEDADARRIKIAKEEIDERKQSDVSIMPGGLAEGLSRQDFADLIGYLETLKDAPPGARPSAGGSGGR
jgi:putative membrane-bound dehydrogenase-like protein